MGIIAHRTNKISQLKALPDTIGVEIDVRFDTRTGRLYLHHDPQGPDSIDSCDFLDNYIEEFIPNQNRIVVFNIKEAGIEERCREIASQRGIKNYFLLDVEFPYIFQATRRGVKEIAVRFSEAEPISQALEFHPKKSKFPVNWIWIDTITKLPLTKQVASELDGFKTCLVCPERWGRPDDIESYAAKIKDFGITLDAVMTATKYCERWEKTGVIKSLAK